MLASVSASQVLAYLDALLVIYMESYVTDSESAPTTQAYISSYELLVDRAARAYDGVKEYPDLADDIYDDFAQEFRMYDGDILKLIAMQKHNQ